MATHDAELFGDTPETLRLTNPIAADLDQLRPTPIATLALAAKRNAARGWPDVALFEIGPAFRADAPDGQVRTAAALRAGSTPRHWAAPARGVDAMDAKADLWAVLARDRRADGCIDGHAGCASLLPPGPLRHGAAGTEDGAWQLRRTASARAGGAGLTGPVAAFELNLDAIGEPRRKRKRRA